MPTSETIQPDLSQIAMSKSALRPHLRTRIQPVQISLHGVTAHQAALRETHGRERASRIDVLVIKQRKAEGKLGYFVVRVHYPPGIDREPIEQPHKFPVADPRRRERARGRDIEFMLRC